MSNNKIKIGVKTFSKEMIHSFEKAKKDRILCFISCNILQNKAALKTQFYKLISTIENSK
jgi:hypothetical protein